MNKWNIPFRNSTFKDIQNPCLRNEKFHFFEYAGTAALYGYAALYEYAGTASLYEYAGTAAKAKSRGQEYPPIELDQALAFNKGASPHLQLRYQPLSSIALGQSQASRIGKPTARQEGDKPPSSC